MTEFVIAHPTLAASSLSQELAQPLDRRLALETTSCSNDGLSAVIILSSGRLARVDRDVLGPATDGRFFQQNPKNDKSHVVVVQLKITSHHHMATYLSLTNCTPPPNLKTITVK
jgi:hypothetical protein